MFGNYTISDKCPNPNHVCEVEEGIDPANYFKSGWQEHTEYRVILMMVIFGALLHCFHVIFTNRTSSFYLAFSGCLIATLFGKMAYQLGPETCSFMRWCHEGVTDTIIPSVYFYQLNECPEYASWLTYYDYDDLYNNDQCEYAKYGCCEIVTGEQLCDTLYRNGDSYSLYMMDLKMNISHWVLPIERYDEEGSNCPTIEELIYQVQREDKRRNNGFYILFQIPLRVAIS